MMTQQTRPQALNKKPAPVVSMTLMWLLVMLVIVIASVQVINCDPMMDGYRVRARFNNNNNADGLLNLLRRRRSYAIDGSIQKYQAQLKPTQYQQQMAAALLSADQPWNSNTGNEPMLEHQLPVSTIIFIVTHTLINQCVHLTNYYLPFDLR